MEIVAFVLVWVWITAANFVGGVRSGEASFAMRAKVTKAENKLLYWLVVAFWFSAFIFLVYELTSLLLHAFQGAPPFNSRGLMPTSSKQWMVAGVDVFCFALLGHAAWSTARVNRLLREMDAVEKTDR